MPATPCRPQQAAAADGEVAVADAGVDAGEACGEAAAAAEMMCEECDAWMGDDEEDYHEDELGKMWCNHCGSHVEPPERPANA